MHGSAKGGRLDLTVPDSSVYVRYVMYLALEALALTAHAGRFFRRSDMRAEAAVKDHLDGKFRDKSVRITETVIMETMQVTMRRIDAWWAQKKISSAEAAQLRGLSWRLTYGTPRHAKCPDDRGEMRRVRGMYDGARADPGNSGLLREWIRKKGTVGPGSPGEADMTILSTAAGLALANRVTLLTADNDFIVFRDAILRLFGICVADPWHL